MQAQTRTDPDEMTFAEWKMTQPPVLTVRRLKVNYVLTQILLTILTGGLWLIFAPAFHVAWYNDCLEVYADRLVRHSGRFYRKSETIPMHRIIDVRVERLLGPPERGFITIATPSGGWRFGLVADPEHIRDVILSLVIH